MTRRMVIVAMGAAWMWAGAGEWARGQALLKDLVVDSVDFQAVDLETGLAFLAAKAESAGPVNFVVIDPDGKLRGASITLKLSRVPWTEALRYVASLAGAELLPEAHAIVLGEKQAVEALRLQRSKISAGPGSEGTAALLAASVVERVVFDDATLGEVADFLRQLDHARVMASPVPVNPLNVIIKENAAKPVATRRIRLDLRRVPLAEVLHYATGLAGCRFRTDARAVVIGESADLARPPGGPANAAGPIFAQLAAKRLETIEIPAGATTAEFVEVMRTLGGVNTIAMAPDAVAASRLALHQVTALELLRYFNEISGTAYRLDPNVLVIAEDPAVKVRPKPPVDGGAVKPGAGGLGFDP
jgi:hypothetical protein